MKAFGVDWLHWWAEGRPESAIGLEFKRKEKEYLLFWRDVVRAQIWEYCDKHGLRRPNRYTTLQPAGCLSREHLRIFDSGLLYADEILLPGSGEITGLNLSVRRGIPVSTGIANQPLQLIKVVLANGRILRMTPNHRLSIGGQWIRADEMKLGMKIDFKLGEYQNSQEVSLLDVDRLIYQRESREMEVGHRRGVLATTIKTPKTMTPDLAYFLGALFGNGCLSPNKSRVRFSVQNPQLIERLQEIGERLFGIKGNPFKTEGKEALDLTFASTQLYDWMQLNGLGKNEKSKFLDRIPLAIRCSSTESILSFFCGLIDTDGCIRNDGSLSIDSASETFIRNLQQIGEAVGLCFSIFHNVKGVNKQEQKDMWGMNLSRMLSLSDALAYINQHSLKAQRRPILAPKRQFAFTPYAIEAIEWEQEPDYSYDFAVEGVDDDDSWYWQGGLKSHNTKSLLTGASPGWHPPKAPRFIRRVTFGKHDPVAMACLEMGYSVVPSQSDKDENGVLLSDPFDPRCTEWLVEFPVEVPWASIPGADVIDISQFSALAQFDFYMQAQRHYVTHNASATVELREHEIEALGTRIHEAIRDDEGYISAALLARFDDKETYPRLPFEPISKEKYEELVKEVQSRRRTDDFYAALRKYDVGEPIEVGPAGCDSDKCLFPQQK